MNDAITFQIAMNAEKDQAIKTTFQRDRKRLFDFIRRRVPSKEEAEDILQEVFFQFTRNVYQLAPIEQVTSWLFRVARNKITDSYRKQKTESLEARQSDPDENDNLNLLNQFYDTNNDPEKEFTRNLIWDELYEALDALPAAQREVFVLHEIEGKDFKQIAEQTGETVNTLISRKRYAVLYLRKRLEYLYKEMFNL
ncbi:MAG TPA: sigma-70 family RNA polymerase sigma factor [Cytophagaceae bacterium]|jgi:RNA polymerase sigma factor (sigma-70 family)|nr:sigma-70 family RNA polymerase sigma factor [Cytophagaceae bacterium]